jgi:predicted O-methyltransferase YrrM
MTTPQSTWTPVKGWETELEQGLLASFARLVPPDGLIVEIGSEHGMSASIFRLHSDDSVFIDCIEIDEKSDFLDNIRKAGIDAKRINWYCGDSKKVKISKNALENGIDLLFVDGDHSYEGAKEDLKRWSPYVKKTGIILIHDVACSTNKQPHEQHYAVATALQHFLGESGLWRIAFSVDSTVVLVRL